MRTFVIAFKDDALNAYTRCMNVPGLGVIVRHFGDMMTDPNNEMSKHPSDYDLYHVGYFDDDTGKLEALEVPERIARGVDYVKGGS